MTAIDATVPTELGPKGAWSLRVRKVGGYIQLAFAAFWLARGGLSVAAPSGSCSPSWGVRSRWRCSATR